MSCAQYKSCTYIDKPKGRKGMRQVFINHRNMTSQGQDTNVLPI